MLERWELGVGRFPEGSIALLAPSPSASAVLELTGRRKMFARLGRCPRALEVVDILVSRSIKLHPSVVQAAASAGNEALLRLLLELPHDAFAYERPRIYYDEDDWEDPACPVNPGSTSPSILFLSYSLLLVLKLP